MFNQISFDGSRNAPPLRPICAVVISALAAWQSDARAVGASANEDVPTAVAQVEFDRGFLAPGSGQALNLSRFEKGVAVPPGTYSVDLYVNDGWIGRTDVRFEEVAGAPEGGNAHACFDKALLGRAGVNLKRLTPEVSAALDTANACLPLREIIADATSSFDFGEQRLELSIPQISLSRNARGYVSPESWDKGINAAFVGYDLNVYSYNAHGQGGAQTQGYLGLNAGVNIGAWHFRHNGSYNWDSHGGQQYQDIATYVQRDLPKLSSQLLVGEAFTTGELFDSTSFRGVRVATDDRMLPDSMRGYAPVVRGVALTNAKVTITQSNVVIYETTVAPGAFEIDDLYATGYGGDLHVSVQEADGSVGTFLVPYSAVPLSLRPGVNRYSFTAGTVRNQQLSGNPFFAQATWQHGFTNLLTGYAGINVAAGYGAAMIGGAFNTPLGAIGLDYTEAVTDLPGQGRMSGGSARISYSKNLPQTGSNVTIAAYRYSTGGFFDLNTAVLARDQLDQNVYTSAVLRQRNRAQLTLSQQLGEKGGQLAVTASTVNYWNRSGSDVNYSVGYNNVYRNVSYGIQATRQRSADGTMSTLYYATIAIPLGKKNPVTVSGNVTYNSGGQTQVQSTLSGAMGVDNALSYSVTANHASGAGSTNTGGNASVLYRSSVAELSASAGASNTYSQGSVGIRGAVVAHPGGVTLSQPLSETFGIVEATDAEGARLLNASGVRVGSGGYAVVPSLTPYNMNRVDLDPNGTSTDVELQVTSQQVAPTAGSIAMLKFATTSGRTAIIRAKQADGTPLPFGATVLNEAGKEIGIVGQASKILARGLEAKGDITVKWGDDAVSRCYIAYELPIRAKGKKTDGYQQVESACKPASLFKSSASGGHIFSAGSDSVELIGDPNGRGQ
jgi:outer membrane usher protein